MASGAIRSAITYHIEKKAESEEREKEQVKEHIKKQLPRDEMIEKKGESASIKWPVELKARGSLSQDR